MKVWEFVLLALAALGWTRESTADDASVATEVDAAASGVVEQTESIFTYDVIERAADRTIDDLRGLDVNVNGLLAVQAALYAILIDSFNVSHPLSWIVPALFLSAICMSAWNLHLGRGANVPEPRAFRQALIEDTPNARDTVIDVLLETAESNDLLLRRKRRLFYRAMTVTLVAALLAPVLRERPRGPGAESPPTSAPTGPAVLMPVPTKAPIPMPSPSARPTNGASVATPGSRV
jgi:hypothetical protein